jgi:WD40 repeat protein
MNNYIIERRLNITELLNKFLPNDISNLIGGYDYYLEGKSQTLIGHTGSVNCIAILHDVHSGFSTDRAERIVSGSSDNTLKIWNVHTGKCEVTFVGHTGPITHVIILPDGRIASASKDKTFKIWNPQNGKCEISFMDDYNDFDCLGVFFDGTFQNEKPNYRLVTAAYSFMIDFYIKLWNVRLCDSTTELPQTGICEAIFHDDCNISHKCVAILPDGHIISEDFEDNLHMWDPQNNDKQTEKFLECNSIHENTKCVILYGDRLFIGGSKGNLKEWNIQNETYDIVSHDHNDQIMSIALLPDGRIVSGSRDNTLKIWNTANRICDITLEHHGINCVCVLSDGRIVSGSDDNTIKIWS